MAVLSANSSRSNPSTEWDMITMLDAPKIPALTKSRWCRQFPCKKCCEKTSLVSERKSEELDMRAKTKGIQTRSIVLTEIQ